MDKSRIAASAAALLLLTAGCANMPQRQWGICAVAGGLVGGTLGGVGGGVGVDQIEPTPSNGERAAGAGAGFAAGALTGALLGHYLCDPIVEQPAPIAEAPPPPPPGTEIVEIRGTHFAFDSAKLTPEGEAIVDEAVAVLEQHSGLSVRCEGHTDSIGSEEYNLRLGQRRADTVCDRLVASGVGADRVAHGRRPRSESARRDHRELTPTSSRTTSVRTVLARAAADAIRDAVRRGGMTTMRRHAEAAIRTRRLARLQHPDDPSRSDAALEREARCARP
jgi:outer membrane protein OmpA-like peptidoglycan-associated protein